MRPHPPPANPGGEDAGRPAHAAATGIRNDPEREDENRESQGRKEKDDMTQEQQHPYSVEIHSPNGLQVISALAGNDREAAQKLRRIAGRNSVQTDTFKKDGQPTPNSAWSAALNTDLNA